MSKLKPSGWCEVCRTRKATCCHEKFPDRQANRRLYGDLLYLRPNTQFVCIECNAGHCMRGKGLVEWDEFQFCNALGIEPKSKVAIAKRRFA